MTIDQVKKFYKGRYPEIILASFNDTCSRYDISTPLRQRHFLAQILHETMNLIYLEEIASGKLYEFRKDLGNIMPGWGVKYKGRGSLMITGAEMYKLASKEFGIDLMKNPELVAQMPLAMLIGGYVWKIKNCNKYADKNDILTISKRINGVNKATGLPNHYPQRVAKLEFVKNAIGI